MTLVDGKGRRFLRMLTPGERFHVTAGYVDADTLIGQEPALRIRTRKGGTLVIYRSTLEEYVLLMPRAAQIMVPKDLGFVLSWADVFPGAFVVEAGIGSGALTLSLLRALGPNGRIVAFELREDHANRARKNIAAWPETAPARIGDRLDIRLGNVHQDLCHLCGVDRVLLDVPDPWEVLPAAAQALKPGGIVLAYAPGIRQMDQFVLAALDSRDFADPEVAEVILRPWAADRIRLRPNLRIIGHTGFVARARRRNRGQINGDADEPATKPEAEAEAD